MAKTTNHKKFKALLQFFETEEAKSPRRIFHPDLDVYNSITNEGSLKKASVLIAVTRPTPQADSQIVLTVRSADLKSHAGQISLPGGKHENTDSDAIATALREVKRKLDSLPAKSKF